MKILGFDCLGKDIFPSYGEMLPEVIRKSVYGETMPTLNYDGKEVVPRPPLLCAGCPHRGLFHQLGKKKMLWYQGI